MTPPSFPATHFPEERGSREAISLWVRACLDEQPCRIGGFAALKLVIDLCENRAVLHDGIQYIYTYARQQGYYLPPFPLAGCGEIREFLHDQGVKNVPQWYEHIGIERALYERLHEYRLLVLLSTTYQRQAIPLAMSWWDMCEQRLTRKHAAVDTACDSPGDATYNSTGDAAHDSFRDDDKALALAKYVVDFIYQERRDPSRITFK